MAQAQKIFETVEVVRTETTLTGVSLHLTLEEASMLRSLLGQISCVRAGSIKGIFDVLYDILPDREYDVLVDGDFKASSIHLRKVK